MTPFLLVINILAWVSDYNDLIIKFYQKINIIKISKLLIFTYKSSTYVS
jgi:hypothetical protein